MAGINCHDLPAPEYMNFDHKRSRSWPNDIRDTENFQDRGVEVEEELKECYGELLKHKTQPSYDNYSEKFIIDGIQS